MLRHWAANVFFKLHRMVGVALKNGQASQLAQGLPATSVFCVVFVFLSCFQKIQTHKRFKRTLFITIKRSIQIFWVIQPFLQNDTTIKRWKLRWRGSKTLICCCLSYVIVFVSSTWKNLCCFLRITLAVILFSDFCFEKTSCFNGVALLCAACTLDPVREAQREAVPRQGVDPAGFPNQSPPTEAAQLPSLHAHVPH